MNSMLLHGTCNLLLQAQAVLGHEGFGGCTARLAVEAAVPILVCMTARYIPFIFKSALISPSPLNVLLRALTQIAFPFTSSRACFTSDAKSLAAPATDAVFHLPSQENTFAPPPKPSPVFLTLINPPTFAKMSGCKSMRRSNLVYKLTFR